MEKTFALRRTRPASGDPPRAQNQARASQSPGLHRKPEAVAPPSARKRCRRAFTDERIRPSPSWCGLQRIAPATFHACSRPRSRCGQAAISRTKRCARQGSRRVIPRVKAPPPPYSSHIHECAEDNPKSEPFQHFKFEGNKSLIIRGNGELRPSFPECYCPRHRSHGHGYGCEFEPGVRIFWLFGVWCGKNHWAAATERSSFPQRKRMAMR